jgi:Ca-activated chloride channel family protein
MIVLTDGEPSENDQKPEIPIEVAQQLGIKIYTVGIGSETVRRIFHPHYGIVMIPTVNRPLLERIAKQTGGQFFQATNPKDMRMIYDTIDTLERDEHDVPVFTCFYELFAWYGSHLVWLLFLIVILSTWMWFGL